MDNVTVRGFAKNVSKKQIQHLANWTFDELGLYRFWKPQIEICVFLKKNFLEKTDYWGWMIWEDCYIKPREFTVEIERSLPEQDLFESLIHEMVHVKQFAQGRLKDRASGFFFEGKHYNSYDPNVNYNKYSKLPWEEEAYSLQRELCHKYMNEE